MAALRDWAARRPAVAGLFYPAEPAECRRLARECVFGSAIAPEGVAPVEPDFGESKEAARTEPRPRKAIALGAIVPHAGWICSGAIAGESIRELSKRAGPVDVVVVFGAVHTPLDLEVAALDTHATWLEPGSETSVAQDVRAKLGETKNLFAVNDEFHHREHAVEVELPLIREAWPDSTLLPIEVPLIDSAIEIGRAVAKRITDGKLRAVF
ncbi:MAG TPA: AmmeMemoRadiSam system protein B, partial [Tepidisphaeraceae bacterium]|nr:AmmeMemoRadiSam system protein B [Tepidisphaeraceae bacterium]